MYTIPKDLTDYQKQLDEAAERLYKDMVASGAILPTGSTVVSESEKNFNRYYYGQFTRPEDNKPITDSSKKECFHWEHEWINVGFHYDKWVCKKCDKDKPSE